MSKDEHQEFYAAIGLAISQWTHVEDVLCRIYLIALGLYNRASSLEQTAPAQAAFHAVVSSDAKAQMADMAISVHLMLTDSDDADDLRKRWDKLRRRVSECQRKRNQLAHFQTLIHPTKDPHLQFTLRPRLQDAGLMVRYDTEASLPVFRTHDLEQIRRPFGRLVREIGELCEALAPLENEPRTAEPSQKIEDKMHDHER